MTADRLPPTSEESPAGDIPLVPQRPAPKPGAASLPRKRKPYRLIVWLTVLLLPGAAVYLLWGRAKAEDSRARQADGSNKAQKGKGKGGAVTSVIAIKARRGDIPVYINGLGAVTPLNTVTVRSRVDGEIMEVLYKEGDLVHKGDLLLRIDPRPYEVQLKQAQGQLMRDQAALENAKTDLSRYQTLLAQRAIPEQQLTTQKSTMEQDEGVVKSDEAQIDSARLNLTFTRITAPLTGRVGLRLVDAGNIVHAGDANGLVVITELQPISVIFTIAEDQLPQVVRKMRAGQALHVDAFDREMKNRLAQGSLTNIDNEIDQTTGTLRLRATFENANEALFPNQFVNARLLLEVKRHVVLLQSAAIQRSSNGMYVYVVKPDSTVTIHQITTGITEGDDSEIVSGLNEGDTVAMTGVDKLVEGAKVNAQFEENRKGKGKGKK